MSATMVGGVNRTDFAFIVQSFVCSRSRAPTQSSKKRKALSQSTGSLVGSLVDWWQSMCWCLNTWLFVSFSLQYFSIIVWSGVQHFKTNGFIMIKLNLRKKCIILRNLAFVHIRFDVWMDGKQGALSCRVESSHVVSLRVLPLGKARQLSGKLATTLRKITRATMALATSSLPNQTNPTQSPPNQHQSYSNTDTAGNPFDGSGGGGRHVESTLHC